MPRIIGVDLPKEKPTHIALTHLYGIGRVSAGRILEACKVDPRKRAKDLTDQEVATLTHTIQASYKVEGDLRRELTANVRRLIDIGSYRGLRHKRGLPVRGQRTRTNSRTRKGPRPRVGGRKKPVAQTGGPKASGPKA